MNDLVNQIVQAGIFKPSEPPRDSWVLGTAQAAAEPGATVSVILDGDSVAVTMLTTVPTANTDRVLTALLGRTRMVTHNLSGRGQMTGTTAGALIAGRTAKTTPAAADQLGLMDSASSNVLKKLAWSDLVAGAQSGIGALMSHVSASRSDAQALANNAYTTLVHTTESVDTLGEYNNSTGVFTATYAGRYLVCCSLITASAAWDPGEVFMLSVDYASAHHHGYRWAAPSSFTGYASSFISHVVPLAAGGALAVTAFQNQGGSVNTYGDATINLLTIDRIP